MRGGGGEGGGGGGGEEARPQGTRSCREAAALPTFAAAAPNCSAVQQLQWRQAVEGTGFELLRITIFTHKPPQQVSFGTKFLAEGNLTSPAKSDKILQIGDQIQISIRLTCNTMCTDFVQKVQMRKTQDMILISLQI